MNEPNDGKSERKFKDSRIWQILVTIEKFIGFVITFIFVLIAFCIALLITCNAVGIQDEVDAAISALPLPQSVSLTLFVLPIILIPAGFAWWEIYGKQPIAVKTEKEEG